MRLVGFACLGGFLFGYDTGVTSGALLFLKVSTYTTLARLSLGAHGYPQPHPSPICKDYPSTQNPKPSTPNP